MTSIVVNLDRMAIGIPTGILGLNLYPKNNDQPSTLKKVKGKSKAVSVFYLLFFKGYLIKHSYWSFF